MSRNAWILYAGWLAAGVAAMTAGGWAVLVWATAWIVWHWVEDVQ